MLLSSSSNNGTSMDWFINWLVPGGGSRDMLRVKASQFPRDVPLDQSDLVAQIPSFGWLKPHWLVPLRSILVSDVPILVDSISISFVN